MREATLADCVEVSRLLCRLGLQFPTDAGLAQRYWKWLWIDNPAQLSSSRPPAIGWVLEADGIVVGFFGSIPIRYRLKDRTLSAAVASSWGIEPRFRIHANEMARQFFSQREVDVLLATTASTAVGRIFGRFDAMRMPQRDYDEVFFWVLDSEAFLRAALRRTAAPLVLVNAGVLAAAPILAAIVRMQGRAAGSGNSSSEVDLISLESVGSEFDDLWRRKGDDGRFYSYRQAADLRWHFALHAEAGTLSVLRCRRGGKLVGYLMMLREEAQSIGLTRAKIVDLFVADDDSTVIDSLVAAATDIARHQACHILETVGFPASIRLHLKRYKPFTRRFTHFPMYFKALSSELDTVLLDKNVWYPTLYDGDSSLY